jgi:monothiol glutaredoxin
MNLQQATQMIDETVKTNDVVVFMKGTPEFPMCGFSGRVVSIFQHFKTPIKGVNVLEDEALRQAIKDYTKWPTIPQIFIKGEFIGGCDITSEMAQSGELEALLKEKLSVSAT